MKRFSLQIFEREFGMTIKYSLLLHKKDENLLSQNP